MSQLSNKALEKPADVQQNVLADSPRGYKQISEAVSTSTTPFMGTTIGLCNNFKLKEILTSLPTLSPRIIAQRSLPLLDFTRLDEFDDLATINELCQNPAVQNSQVAAVCVYPQFVEFAYQQLKTTQVKLATVANFPYGDQPLGQVEQEINHSLAGGANEIDVVIPYQRIMAGDIQSSINLLQACRMICRQHTLKVILETGVLKTPELILQASELAIQSGANFLKTSTGKSRVNATLEAAALMLLSIKESGRVIGFKASGGIQTLEQAGQYLALADYIMGKDWVSPQSFRFGASRLLTAIVAELS